MYVCAYMWECSHSAVWDQLQIYAKSVMVCKKCCFACGKCVGEDNQNNFNFIFIYILISLLLSLLGWRDYVIEDH